MGIFSSLGSALAVVNPVAAIANPQLYKGGITGGLQAATQGMGSNIGGVTNSFASGAGLLVPNPSTNYNIDPNAFTNSQSGDRQIAIQQAMLANMAKNNQQTPNSIAAPNVSNQADQARQQQLALAQMLQTQAAGGNTGPSLAEMQMQKGSENAIKSQAAALASNRGVNAGLGARLAGQSAAGMQQQNVADTGALRAQEQVAQQQQQLASQNALANVLSGTRTQDLSSSQQNIAAQQNAQQMGLTAQAQANQYNTSQDQLQQDMTKYYQQALLDQAEKDRQAQIARQQMGVQLATGQMNAQNQTNIANANTQSNLISAGGSVLGAFV